MNLTDRTIIITGASGGIGGAIARDVAAHGAKVMLTARTESKLQALRDELINAGAQAAYHPGDVTVEADCRAIVQATLDTFGAVDVLVNNAGYGPAAPLLETTEELWDVTLNACLKSAYLMSRAVMPHLLANTDG
ncbi:MAG: SDR family NAD(P)-dependent oxidoreductase, partial [Chloroflexota bacterium]